MAAGGGGGRLTFSFVLSAAPTVKSFSTEPLRPKPKIGVQEIKVPLSSAHCSYYATDLTGSVTY